MGTESSATEDIGMFESFMASFFYMHGLIFSSYPRINPPAWSLEIEFQFYILAPFFLMTIFWIIKRLNWRKAFVPTLLIFMLLLKFIVYMIFLRKYQPFIVTNYIQYFILGFIVCFMYLDKKLEQNFFKKYASFLFVSGFAVFVVCDYLMKPYGMNLLFYDKGEYPYIMLLETIKYFGMFIFFAGVMAGGIGRRISQITLISTIGGMCYSIYLIHLFILQIGTTTYFHFFSDFSQSFVVNLIFLGLLLVPLTLLLSAVFFVIIEKPCMDPDWLKKIINYFRSNRTLPSND